MYTEEQYNNIKESIVKSGFCDVGEVFFEVDSQHRRMMIRAATANTPIFFFNNNEMRQLPWEREVDQLEDKIRNHLFELSIWNDQRV